mmetsp:Transcript_40466/g.52097  ORF Transcript_40466/g.52097 Transcript_40466/m.52097 type:complete len:208 (-) Transcript_40466:134-757(-)
MDIDGATSIDQQFLEGDFQGAISTCETYEIENCGIENDETNLNYTKQLILYMIVDEMDNARHLWRRIGDNIKTQAPQIGTVWEIGKLLWQRTNVPGAFQLLNGDFHPSIQQYISKLIEQLRERQVELFGRAYKCINLSTISLAIGLNETLALQECLKNGWAYDESTKSFTLPTPLPVKSDINGLGEIAKLMDHVAFLERNSVTKAIS